MWHLVNGGLPAVASLSTVDEVYVDRHVETEIAHHETVVGDPELDTTYQLQLFLDDVCDVCETPSAVVER